MDKLAIYWQNFVQVRLHLKLLLKYDRMTLVVFELLEQRLCIS